MDDDRNGDFNIWRLNQPAWKRDIEEEDYPLVNVYIAIENSHL